MALTAGIVGLPNVGKSTLFNAITKAGAHAANYPFATIDPNVGIVDVPDERLNKIADIIQPKSLVPTSFEFTDIAGLVKGASKGEGLGNQFLSHIREVEAIIHVVRCFDNADIPHVDGSIDPVRDIDTIHTELVYADLDIVEKRLPRIEKKAKLKVEKDMVLEHELLKRIHEALLENRPIRELSLTDEEKKELKSYGFLTLKPMLYVANISEEDLINVQDNEYVKALYDLASTQNAEAITISAQIESELSELDSDDKTAYLDELGLKASGLDRLVQRSYTLLNLKTFFTAGEKEVRAWTFKVGMTAPQCAAVIHTDFQRGFIRAETMTFSDLVKYGTMQKVKEAGKMRLEGKDYVVKDGDILLFRFNI
jgi:GTP-binding protein YchF